MTKDPQAELHSSKQLSGRFVRITSSNALATWHRAGINAHQWFLDRPDLMRERDDKFFRRRDQTGLGRPACAHACQAVVRGKRCNRPAIPETDNRHCIKHAGPFYARLYRENCRKLFESGRMPAGKWFKDEARRARTTIRDRQRRKRDGWKLPGVTLRFAGPIEESFRADVGLMLSTPWEDVPDYHRDQLRWSWRKFMLDRQKPAAWDAKARAILLDLQWLGPVEGGLAHATGCEPHVLVVEHRCTAFSWRSRLSDAEVERAMRTPAEARQAGASRSRGDKTGRIKTPGKGAKPTERRAAARRAAEANLDRLLQLYRRDLREVLAETNEAAWPAMLEAYHAYVVDPTAQRHRQWIAIWRDAASVA